MAAVLNDGSPASLRALELASIPGFLINHDEQQLLILHGMAESKDPAQQQAIPAALEVINKSRVAQNSLNYKIEMKKVLSFEAPNASASIGGTPTPAGNTPAPGDKPTKGKKPDPKSAPAPAVSDAPPAPPKPDKGPEEVAAAVADYCEDRCKHHCIDTILLGVGASMQGKSIAVGTVAKEFVRKFRSQNGQRLLFLKSTGPVIRPTAALRMVVLVIPDQANPCAHLQRVLEMCSTQGRGDRVGVLIVANNGRPKPSAPITEPVVSMDEAPAEVNSGADTAAMATRECIELLHQHGLKDASTGHTADEGASVAQETFPLLSTLVLEPTNQLPTPTVDEVPNQLIKSLAGFKCDFLVLPPASGDESAVSSDQLALACLAAPKPHVMLL
jgi:hypothetical protein